MAVAEISTHPIVITGRKMKVNFACGKQTWEGWFCIDAQQHAKASRDVDLLHAFQFDGEHLVNRLPIEDEAASEVHSYHFIEHVYRWEAPAVIREFLRILKPGGRLVLELPNLEGACRALLKGKKDQLCMWPLYGDPTHKDPYMCHRWGYTPSSMRQLLTECGMRDVRFGLPQTHGRRHERDMRVECCK